MAEIRPDHAAAKHVANVREIRSQQWFTALNKQEPQTVLIEPCEYVSNLRARHLVAPDVERQIAVAAVGVTSQTYLENRQHGSTPAEIVQGCGDGSDGI